MIFMFFPLHFMSFYEGAHFRLEYCAEFHIVTELRGFISRAEKMAFLINYLPRLASGNWKTWKEVFCHTGIQITATRLLL